MIKIQRQFKVLAALLAVFTTVIALSPVRVLALSTDDVLLRAYNAKAAAAIQVISNESLFNITYVGASTQAAVVITSGTFGTEAPIGTADLSYNIGAAAYDTVGELCDAIQAETDYTCAMTGGKRDDASYLTQNAAASTTTDAKAAGGYNVLIDTGGVVDSGVQHILTLGITPASGKSVVLKYCIGNINVIDSLNVYGKLAKYAGDTTVTRNDTTKVYSAITADDTDKTIGNIYGVPWLEFVKDAHVVVRSLDADSVQAAANYIECVWDEK